MNAFKWFFTIWWSLNVVIAIVQVGKPRKPFTANFAAFIFLVMTTFIGWMWAVLP